MRRRQQLALIVCESHVPRAFIVNVLRLSALCPAAWKCIHVLRCLGSNNTKKKCRTNYSVRRCYCFFLLCSHFPSRSLTISFFCFYLLLFFSLFLYDASENLSQRIWDATVCKKYPLLCASSSSPLSSAFASSLVCYLVSSTWPAATVATANVLVHGITWFWHKNSGDFFSPFLPEKRKQQTHKPMSEYNGSSCISTTLFSHLIFALVFMLL